MKTLIHPATPIEDVQRRLQAALNKLCGDKGPWKWDEHNADAKLAIEAWIAAGDLRQLPRLSGPSGTGKSRLIQGASTVLLSLHGCGIRTLEAVEMPGQYVRSQKSSGDYIAMLADPDKYPLLVIEDIGLEPLAPSFIPGHAGIHVVAQVVQIRHKRWEAGMPLATGFTDNLDDAALMAWSDERCVSRMGHMTFWAKVTGSNRRTDAALPLPATTLAEIPKQLEFDPTSPEVLAAIEKVRTHTDVKRMERIAEAAKKKADYIDKMQQRVHRMDLAELHQVIQTDVFPEVRDIARNRFEYVSPIKYAEFCEQLAESERRKAEEQERAA